MDELISLNSYLNVASNNLNINSQTQSFSNQLATLQTQLIVHLNLYQILYEKSIDSDYTSLETSITNNLVPLLNSSNFIFTLFNAYLVSWQTEFTFANHQYYSLDDFNYIYKLINELNKFASNQLLNSYNKLQDYYLSSNYYYLVVFYRSKIYIYSQLINSTDNLMKVINQEINKLQNGVDVNQTDFNTFKMTHDAIVSLFKSLESVQKDLFNFTKSCKALYPNNTEILFYPLSAESDVHADEQPAIGDPSLNSWRFANTHSGKINWYFGNFTNSDNVAFQNVSSIFFIAKFNSTVNKPFIAIYTQTIQGQRSGWYGSRKAFTLYDVNNTDTYLVYMKNDPTSSFPDNTLQSFQQKVQITHDPTDNSFRSNNGQSDINDTDLMFLISIQTNSSAAANTVDFSLLQFGYVLNTKQVVCNTKINFTDLLN
jgi:hypothetical protein